MMAMYSSRKTPGFIWFAGQNGITRKRDEAHEIRARSTRAVSRNYYKALRKESMYPYSLHDDP
jgi:hypothetical protein